MNYRSLFAYLFAITLTVLILIYPYLTSKSSEDADPNSLRIMTYSSFIHEGGAGRQLAENFTKETGIKIHWINAGNAGLLLERLKFKRDSDQPDLVIGFDQFSIFDARKAFTWLDLHEYSDQMENNLLPKGARFYDFLAYDWGPMTFVYREGELPAPTRLEDLLDPIYKNRLVLQDPRMSSPGLQFLLWIVGEMGEDKGFDFLRSLKSSVKTMAPSWSSSFSVFKMQQPSMVFSYFASATFAEAASKGKSNLRATVFATPHPVQVEYAGIPDFCVRCDSARLFAQFLLRTESQKILMEKNFMYPVSGLALEEGFVALPENASYHDPIESLALIQKKRELINRWKKVFY